MEAEGGAVFVEPGGEAGCTRGIQRGRCIQMQSRGGSSGFGVTVNFTGVHTSDLTAIPQGRRNVLNRMRIRERGETLRDEGVGGGDVTGDEEIVHEAAILFPCEDGVAEKPAHGFCDGVGERRGNVNEADAAAETSGDARDEVVEGVGFGADGVDGVIVGAFGGVSEKRGHVADENGLDAVASIAGNREHGKVADEPGDVVDENVFASEDDGGTENGEGKSGVADGFFEARLSAVIRERRVERSVGDADVDEAADSGGLGGVDERASVFDGALEGHLAVREAHPVGVD